MQVSVRDVALRAGVSVGTVSNVLNRPSRVRPDTIAKVSAAIAELGFVPNAAARQLRAGKSTSIALIVLDIGNPFFTDVALGVERRAALEGMSVLLANSGDDAEREGQQLDLFERQRVAGVLVVPVGDAEPRLTQLRQRGIPVVLVDRRAGESTLPSVAVDDVAGGEMAARHLLDTGRRRLACVGGLDGIRQVADRRAGAAKAVADVDGATVEVIPSNALSLDAGIQLGEGLRERVARGEIDGILAANDLVAIGVQQGLLAGPTQVRIPADVGLVGYDDIQFAAAAVVPITSVRQPRDLIGATAVELLLAEHDVDGARVEQHVVFTPELVVRASSSPRED
ncbi:LacI family transcriptional regulator [Demequina sp. TTPB684]|uniref:LacI family DNA-binding transcriptional regulator n=1 Tax=unclassified Demequina TaxID=2620311 RepID=UPI001CF47415|nr:LacI family DNA-binding transcriptional regulator [Demequina sp. TMPB413]MCB2411861.1 LacI family transcriptional regulator [Demequina sp. TTPB684]UPU88615.1 LacI family transcriptional regulator [Demequina sp. TMPB413]